jgi:class 3 adenylate cyclase
MVACPRCGSAIPGEARFCPSCAASVRDVVLPSDERKVATVVFADLVGSTELAGSQDPERTRMLLDRFYDAMADEIGRAGGTVEKFIGDAVMAAFGVPVALEDHAERALHAALAMQQRLGELFGGQLSLRIGVNTGEVVVGRAREGSSFVSGDAVNVGARLEQAAGAGEVLVGERTVAAVRGAFEFGDGVSVEVKGRYTSCWTARPPTSACLRSATSCAVASARRSPASGSTRSNMRSRASTRAAPPRRRHTPRSGYLSTSESARRCTPRRPLS